MGTRFFLLLLALVFGCQALERQVGDEALRLDDYVDGKVNRHFYYLQPAALDTAADAVSNRHRREAAATPAAEVPAVPARVPKRVGPSGKVKKGRNMEALIAQAKQYLEPEEISNIDLNDEAQVRKLDELINVQQARNANFNFGYSIHDEISDSSIQRTEERNGLSLQGQYSYSDGFFRHKVSYVADDKGYRVTSMESEPIGEGPIKNKLGKAIVQQLVSGVETQYAIQAQPVDDTTDPEARDAQGGIRLVQVEPDFIDAEIA